MLWHVGSSSLTMIELGSPALGAGILSHRTTREIPLLTVLFLTSGLQNYERYISALLSHLFVAICHGSHRKLIQLPT